MSAPNRGRWRYDERTGEIVEETPAPPVETDDRAAETARRRREQDERDAHPGTYL